MRSAGPGRCLIVLTGFIQCCSVTNSVVPLFPFHACFCRCYKSGTTTTISYFLHVLHAQPSSHVLALCKVCFCQTVSLHIFGTKLKSRLYTRKVQLHPHRIIACWQSMAVSTDFLQTWSGTYWWTGILLNTKYQTHNLVSAPQGTPTNPSLFCDTFSLLQKRKK